MSSHMLVSHSHKYCSFALNFEIKKCESSNFLLCFQNYVGYSVSLPFPYKCKNQLVDSYKKKAGNLIGIVLNLYINLGALSS